MFIEGTKSAKRKKITKNLISYEPFRVISNVEGLMCKIHMRLRTELKIFGYGGPLCKCTYIYK